MTDATASANPPAELDVVAVGNAIVDVIAHADESFLVEHELAKGSMRLIDTEQAGRLYDAMGPGSESSGGSAANTMAGVAGLGGRAGFVGKVRDDQLGEVFAHDIKAIGVEFVSPPAAEGPPTATCLILVTPDAQRTMNTYLGTAGLLTPDDIDPAFIASAEVTYGEGYLWAEPGAKAALTHAFATARAAGRRTAFTLSDAFCVDQNRAEFLELLDGHVDIVFANEAEICSLFEVDSFDAALVEVRARPGIWALTRSSQGLGGGGRRGRARGRGRARRARRRHHRCGRPLRRRLPLRPHPRARLRRLRPARRHRRGGDHLARGRPSGGVPHRPHPGRRAGPAHVAPRAGGG